jgi:septum formation protein
VQRISIKSSLVNTFPTLILASASPRRQELLRNAAIAFTVEAADIDESALAGESARQCAERLAREKALAISRRHPHQFVIGADTIVVVDGAMLGKPRNQEDAAHMLRILSGRKHEVITGVCLVVPGVNERASISISSDTTAVTMCDLSDEEIRDYVATGEPMDKAGSYASQGIASRWITRIEGNYSNVVGLPVALVYGMLRKAGAL